MSSTIASSILRKFSTCRSSLIENGDGADLGHPLDDVRDVVAEGLADALDGGERVLDDVVEQAGGDADDVQLHVGEDVGDLERMDEVGLARMADLSLVLQGRKHVGPPEQLEVRVWAVAPDLFEQVLEANHSNRCLTVRGRPVASGPRAEGWADRTDCLPDGNDRGGVAGGQETGLYSRSSAGSAAGPTSPCRSNRPRI